MKLGKDALDHQKKKNQAKSKAPIQKKAKASPVTSIIPPSPRISYPIVGIGASAGGLEAFVKLLSHMPTETGMAFVLIQHLDPAHESMSAEILSRATKMPVHEAQDGIRVEPDHVYVIPPNCNMAILQGVLSLFPRTETRGQHMVIDYFFQSLAQDQKAKAIGVVLSGTANDGTQGLKAIKAEGGLAVAQDPASAKYDGMPRSAIASGAVDLILPPGEIAQELARIASHPYIAAACEASPQAEDREEEQGQTQPDDALRKIFILLRTHMQVDFSNYKRATLKRRIQRRMMVRKTESLATYAAYLQAHPDEIRALYSDILIHVTEFFRDPDSFKALTEQVFPSLVKKGDDLAPIRIWVPGCSSGEETYSLAILLLEFLGDAGVRTPIQIFATDISEQAIQKARLGVYPESIERTVSKERLYRFFDKVENGYKINKAIRDLCLFSRHDVTSDPPFAKLDLISCRNVLIYFSPILQKRVVPIFHYALNPGGFLWLGRSESPGGFSKLFTLLDKTHKLYSKINTPTPMTLHFPLSSYVPEADSVAKEASKYPKPGTDFQRDADRIALSKYSPPGVVVNADLDILQFRGRSVPYLEPASGLTTNHLLRMARQELQPALRMALHSAAEQNGPIRKEGLSFEVDGKHRTVDIEVIPVNPLAPSRQRNFVVFFEEVSSIPLPDKSPAGGKSVKDEQGQRIDQLEQEFSESKQYQQSMIEQFEATQEELTSANEELQSTNEELQSTNEELETAKEELQSSNEELTTVNDELQSRNNDLTTLSSDLSNLLVSVEIPILIIGGDHRIRRFTPKAEKLFHLIPSDAGRPIGDIKPDFDINLDSLVSEVTDSLTLQEKEIQDHHGRWMRLQVRPYKTIDNRLDGVVIALTDIDALKQSLGASDAALKYATSLADTVKLPIVVLDRELRLRSANLFFYESFKISPLKIGGDFFEILGIQIENLPKLNDALKETLIADRAFEKFEIEHDFPGVGLRHLLLSGRQIHWSGSEFPATLLTLEDITERKRIEKELAQGLIREREARADAEKGNQAKDLFLATLSHELRTPLTTILSWAQMLRMGKLDAEKSKKGVEMIEQSAKAQGQLINDLLDVSRIIMGKLSLEMQEVDPAAVIKSAVDSVQLTAEKKSISIQTTLDPSPGIVSADPVRLQQVIWNLLTNAIKFSPQGGHIEVRLSRIETPPGGQARIQVIDQGKGILPDFLPHIFDRFSQADSTSTRIHGGLGLGLAIARNLVELEGGNIQAESPGEGKGATFTVNLPLKSQPSGARIAPSAPEPVSPPLADSATRVVLDGIRVLLVDDEENTREALTIMFHSFGAEVLTAASAGEALSLVTSFKPHVLVSDIAMPGEDGYALIRKIRALEPTRGGQTPALALTAYAGGKEVQRALAAGFQAHIAKPTDAIELAATVARLAEGNRK